MLLKQLRRRGATSHVTNLHSAHNKKNIKNNKTKTHRKKFKFISPPKNQQYNIVKLQKKNINYLYNTLQTLAIT